MKKKNYKKVPKKHTKSLKKMIKMPGKGKAKYKGKVKTGPMKRYNKKK